MNMKAHEEEQVQTALEISFMNEEIRKFTEDLYVDIFIDTFPFFYRKASANQKAIREMIVRDHSDEIEKSADKLSFFIDEILSKNGK